MMTSVMQEMKNRQEAFKEEDQMSLELSRAVVNSKIQSTYLSNKTIASIIVGCLDISDAENIATEILSELKRRGDMKPGEFNGKKSKITAV